MNVTRAVVTAAARDQRALPLQRLVDSDGAEKTALEIVIEEVLAGGIEEICLVICPGDESAYRDAAGQYAGRLSFMTQAEPRGYGHALLQAAGFVKDEPFAHLVSDHLYVSREGKRCAQQLLDVARQQGCCVSAVQATRESMLPYYGTVGGRRVPQQARLYEVETVAEKPTPTQAEQTLLVPGLRAGHYLCLFGMHVLMPTVMEVLAKQADSVKGGRLQLSPALAQAARQERYLALEVDGNRYNIGVKYGVFAAQLALALAGKDREEVLAMLLEQVASRAGR